MTMRVLVTGASGMLGGAVARALAQRGDDVVLMQRRPSGLDLPELLVDLRDRDAVRSAVRDVDGVIHLAAKVNVVGPWAEYAAVNVEGTRTMLEEARARATADNARLLVIAFPVGRGTQNTVDRVKKLDWAMWEIDR